MHKRFTRFTGCGFTLCLSHLSTQTESAESSQSTSNISSLLKRAEFRERNAKESALTRVKRAPLHFKYILEQRVSRKTEFAPFGKIVMPKVLLVQKRSVANVTFAEVKFFTFSGRDDHDFGHFTFLKLLKATSTTRVELARKIRIAGS